MRESVWGYAVIALGILAIGIIWFMSTVTNTDQHNYNLLKETVEASMYDAVDLAAYRKDGTIAELSNIYVIDVYDITETPPKVSLRVSSTKSNSSTNEIIEFDVINNIDAILETKY